jgi:signal transduction histidine kinase
MNAWFQKTFIFDGLTPDGALAAFSLPKQKPWPSAIAFAVGAILYFQLAQTWLVTALNLWLAYAAGVLSLGLLERLRGVRARLIEIILSLVVGVALGTALGAAIWYYSIGSGVFRWSMITPQLGLPIAFGLMTCSYFMVRDFVRSERASAVRAQQAMERQRQEAAKQAAEAQLRLLQAQIEPHFLLNTLANVRSLVNRDHARARDMLDHLSDYLHVALPRMRQDSSTLEREIALSASFLSIMQIRMGGRLQFDLAIDDETKALPFPPMLLQTLVENAIKHGIEPMHTPGRVHIASHIVVDDEGASILQVSVSDTGVGFGGANTSGTRIGLANIRERLKSLYGSRASLEISPNQPTGVIARLHIPVSYTANI